MEPIRIGNKLVGEGKPCYVIAEIGINHNGKLDLAKQMIVEAYKAGADCVKFQKRTPKDIMIKKRIDEEPKDILSILTGNLEFNEEQYVELKEYADSFDMDFSASVWDKRSADFIDSLNPPFHKIASADLTNLPLLEHVAKMKRPIVLSTGMADLEEVDHAVNLIKKYNKQIIIMQCTSTYPSRFEELNLRAIEMIKKRYSLNVGFSGHEPGVHIPVSAVALGACMVEKHITLDKHMRGPDHKASIDFADLSEMVRKIRDVELALGTSEKKILKGEIPVREWLTKSVRAATDIKKGTVLAEENMLLKGLGTGLPPRYLDLLIGKKLKRDLKKEDLIMLEDVEGGENLNKRPEEEDNLEEAWDED